MSRETLPKTDCEGNASSSPHICALLWGHSAQGILVCPLQPRWAQPSTVAAAGGLLASMLPLVPSCARLGRGNDGLVTVLGRVTPTHALMLLTKARR